MGESSLTVAILREIRDETRATRTELSERIDHLTERVDAQGALLHTVANVQIRQEALLQRLVDSSLRHETMLERHEGALHSIHHELGRIHDRIDHIYEGPLSGALRDHEVRLRRLEERDQ